MSPSIASIKAAVCAHYGLKAVEINSSTRERRVARPRQVGMFLARRLTPSGLQQIAAWFGRTDHTTAMYAVRHIDQLRLTDCELAIDLRVLTLGLLGANKGVDDCGNSHGERRAGEA